MRGFKIGLTCLALLACAPTDYQWQYRYEPAKGDYISDLEYCRSYAAKQYQPGVPKGSPYLKDDQGYPHGNSQKSLDVEDGAKAPGEWRQDRDPWQQVNINERPVHDVPAEQTGYPGYLDYFPSYSDEILNKSMYDRGWVYRPKNSTGPKSGN